MMRFKRIIHYGVVAVLDALGARLFSDTETKRFLESRKIVLKLLAEKADIEAVKLQENQITTFTFNDTVLIVLKSGNGGPINDASLRAFLRVLRKFIVDSLAKSILFRGSFSIGTFLMDTPSNTIMGEAVTDAAAWYDKADWIGVHATPRAYLDIIHRMESGKNANDWNYCLADYNIPMKSGLPLVSKAINWPNRFLAKNSLLREESETPRQSFLRHIGKHRVPFGTESKYFHTLAFFDYIVKKQQSS